MLPRLPNTREGNSDILVHGNTLKLFVLYDIKVITPFVISMLLRLQPFAKESEASSLTF